MREEHHKRLTLLHSKNSEGTKKDSGRTERYDGGERTNWI